MTAVSDRTLRGVAWAVCGFLASMIAITLLLSLVDPPAATTDDAVDQLGFLIVISVFPLVGLLIVRRQPRNTVGWLLLGVGLVWCVGGATENYARYGLVVNPGSLPEPAAAAVINAAIWAPAIGLMGTFVILLYPDGHLPSPRWRPVAWLSGATVVALTTTLCLTPGRLEFGPGKGLRNPLGWEAAESVIGVLFGVLLSLLPLCIVACAGALVSRFRRSRGLERLQLKWLATAGAAVAVLFLLAIFTSVALPDTVTDSDGARPWLSVLDAASFLSFALLPAAIGVAILRHRLYDIDVVINRALVYGSLTALLGAVYLGSVLLLQMLINPITRESDLAVVGSTLAVAGLFRPARGRIQGIVDRRFYRSRYDAARTLEDFSARLRNELDLQTLDSDLRRVVHDTVQPAYVALWLRDRS
jgi:hypothetical protein